MELLTGPEAARLLRISESSLARLRRNGKIKTIKIGNCIRFHLDDLIRYVNEQTFPKRMAKI